MSKVVLGFILLISISAWAEIQVPENCIDKVYPCLVRADKLTDFKQANLSIQLTAKSIVKIIKDGSQLSLELLTGRMSVKEMTPSSETVSLNSVLIEAPEVMAFRDRDQLEILNLSNFTKVRYSLNFQNNGAPVRLASRFLSKGELVDFSRYYFSDVRSFRNFLGALEPNWVLEFKKQNESQTKALMRSVASEEKAAEDRVREEQARERQIKKVKDEFFFRTFKR